MASTISVYYKYTNDIDILLGSYEKPSPPHGGIYEEGDGYTKYNDGYCVQTGYVKGVTKDDQRISTNLKVPFINTSYSLSFPATESGILTAHSYSKRTNYFSVHIYYHHNVIGDGPFEAAYEATGYWK